MNILKKITTILFILCITGVSNAYPEAWGQINFSYISINDGLSQSTVFSIAQDKLGNMWFATYDGVNKYDGYTYISTMKTTPTASPTTSPALL